jgi:hypothetical protein
LLLPGASIIQTSKCGGNFLFNHSKSNCALSEVGSFVREPPDSLTWDLISSIVDLNELFIRRDCVVQ